MTPGRKLRSLLDSPKPEYLVEAHNPAAAIIAEEAGISGLWGSSLTFSASWGMRDTNELTMSQVFEVLEAMTDRVDVPILFDGDTGYGSFNHFQRLVRGLCLRNVAGVCIEDKVFPKTNSFIASETQRLAPAEEFANKLRAGKDAQTDDDFVIVARTEAFITGLGLEVALERAALYVDAGADAVLVHSKVTTFAQVSSFMKRWDLDVPVVCVPTTYFGTAPEAFESAGVSLVIWANHMLRASIKAMQSTAAAIKRSSGVRDVVDACVEVPELFRLQGATELAEAERRYGARSGVKGVILAASRGSALGELTADKPKCMLRVGGQPVIEKLVGHLRTEGVRDLTVVRGHAPEALALTGVGFRDNPRWQETGELASLACAADVLEGDTLVVYGDVLFKRYILRELLASPAPLTIVVDASLQSGAGPDRVQASAPASKLYDEREHHLLRIGADVDAGDTHGEWIGLLYAQNEGTALLRTALEEVMEGEGGERLQMSDLFNHLVNVQDAPIRILYIRGDWLDIDNVQDLVREQL